MDIMKHLVLIAGLILGCNLFAQRPEPDTIPATDGAISIQPIYHASLVLQWNGKTIYVDPTRGAEAYAGIPAPDIILITDIHGDHTDLNTLRALDTQNAVFVIPPAVADMLKHDFEKQMQIVKNGGIVSLDGILINAMPMYNLPESDDAFHPRGRGNGYYLKMGGKKLYISGDTADIKEMRDLKGIDVAFVCMNLPYTMDINQAADAVLDFKPKVVYPYHYRGKPDMSDVEAFKKMVNDKNPKIEVRLRNWYPN